MTGSPLALHNALVREPDADPEEVALRLCADVFEQIVTVISESIWVEFPALGKSRRADRVTVDELAREWASELTGRLSAYPLSAPSSVLGIPHTRPASPLPVCSSSSVQAKPDAEGTWLRPQRAGQTLSTGMLR